MRLGEMGYGIGRDSIGLASSCSVMVGLEKVRQDQIRLDFHLWQVGLCLDLTSHDKVGLVQIRHGKFRFDRFGRALIG